MTPAFGVRHEWGALREAAVGDAPALAQLLSREGVTVHREASPAPRDPLIVVGRHLIEGSLRFENRQTERDALRPLAERLGQRPGVQWSASPPGWPNGIEGPFLEGGDVLVNGREVYVGMSGQSSDMAGIDWLEQVLGRDHRVIPVAMRSSVKHLEDVLALIRPGLLVSCPGLLIDGLPMSLRGWDAITLAPEEAGRRCAHLVVLEPGRAVVDTGNVRLGGELRSRGIETLALPFPSGLRAAHLALSRESGLE